MKKNGAYPAFILGFLILIISMGIITQPAKAVWHVLLNERFHQEPITWPWAPWTINPNLPWSGSGPPFTWGVQDYLFKVNGLDNQSLWCVGNPNNLDPEFDHYPPNTNCWVKWGPIDLSDAVAARASFWYYIDSQPYSDYVRWGAYPANAFNMYEMDRCSGLTPEWMYSYVDFDSLEGGTTSLLGEPNVYLVFQFYSNGDTEVGIGAFIDEVSIAWDDGYYDFEALGISFAQPDSSWTYEAVIGDTMLFKLDWKAYGSGVTPPFDITCYLDEAPLYTERRSVDIGGSQMVWDETYTDPWIVTSGTHTVGWYLDSSREIEESDETNNDTLITFESQAQNVPPWIHFFHPTYGDTAATEFLITWEDEDPDDNAMISLYWDLDSTGFDGYPISGASYILEDDLADSFMFDVSGINEGEVWVFAYMTDNQVETWQYSDGPLIVDYDWVNASPVKYPGFAEDFTLETVYPNPFNSSTKIRFGLPAAGTIALKIYDSMGRLCAEPFRGTLSAGYHDIAWSPGDLPSGLYFIELAGQEMKLRAKALYLK